MSDSKNNLIHKLRGLAVLVTGLLLLSLISPNRAAESRVYYPPGSLLQPNDVASTTIRAASIYDSHVAAAADVNISKIADFTWAQLSDVLATSTSAGSLVYFGGTDYTTSTGPGGTGYVVMASGTTPIWGNLAAGTNVTVTTSTPGTITIAATAANLQTTTGQDWIFDEDTATTDANLLTIGTIYSNVSSGGTTGTESRFHMATTTVTTSTAASWANNITWDANIAFSSDWVDSVAFWGMGLGNNGALAQNSTTTRHIGFICLDAAVQANCYASVANGTTQSTSTITVATPANWHHYTIVWTSGTNAQFFIDETSVATISTNIPSGTASFTGMKFSTKSLAGPGNDIDIDFTTQVRLRYEF